MVRSDALLLAGDHRDDAVQLIGPGEGWHRSRNYRVVDIVVAPAAITTRDRVLAVALDRFGTRGVDAVSLDEIAAVVGVRKQTVLYWFASKEELVDAVLDATVAEIALVIDAAVKAASDDPLERVDAVVRAAFGMAVRRPALLGLVRELSRLPRPQADRLRAHVDPLIGRAVAFLGTEMDAGRLRAGDPRLVAALAYGTVTGHRHRARGAAQRGLGRLAGRVATPAGRAAGVPARRARALTARPDRLTARQEFIECCCCLNPCSMPHSTAWVRLDTPILR